MVGVVYADGSEVPVHVCNSVLPVLSSAPMYSFNYGSPQNREVSATTTTTTPVTTSLT